MKRLRAIKRASRSEAVKQGITTGLKNKVFKNKTGKVVGYQRFNPMRNIERHAVKKYNELNYHEKTKLNLELDKNGI